MSEFAFLPVNLDRNAGRQGRQLGLVRVDEELRLSLLRKAWSWQKRTNGVFCRELALQYEVLQVGKGTGIFFHNGDCLDFRRVNLLPVQGAARQEGAVGTRTSFQHKDEYYEALRELHEHLDYYRAEAKSSRSRFSVAVTREILEYVRKECATLPADAVRAQVSLVWNKGEELSAPLFTQLLSGRTNVVPDYDYAALEKTRPAAGRPSLS